GGEHAKGAGSRGMLGRQVIEVARGEGWRTTGEQVEGQGIEDRPEQEGGDDGRKEVARGPLAWEQCLRGRSGAGRSGTREEEDADPEGRAQHEVEPEEGRSLLLDELRDEPFDPGYPEGGYLLLDPLPNGCSPEAPDAQDEDGEAGDGQHG